MALTFLRYRRNREDLLELLKPFGGGQYQLETSEHEIYRGGVISVLPSKVSNRSVFIEVSFLCLRGSFFDECGIPTERWYPVPPPLSKHRFLDFRYTVYYPHDVEGRLKLKGKHETSYFFLPGDSTNLVQEGEDFIRPPQKLP